jgi:hypothetical protein
MRLIKNGIILAFIFIFNFLQAQSNDSIINNILVSDTLNNGKIVCDTKCLNCHKVIDPGKFTTQQWSPIVAKMQKRSKITDTEKEMLIKYLASKAKKEDESISSDIKDNSILQ